MKFPEVTTLQNLQSFSADDFDVSPEMWQEMEAAQDLGLPVTIDCLACDNGHEGYWDITLPSGNTVEAVSGYHLASKEL